MNRLKKALENNWVTFGTWIQIPNIAVIEIISKSFGDKLDWICIDLEHGLIDVESLPSLFSAIESFGIIPIARIPKNDYIWIHRTLDAGAKGIIIPMIKDHKEVEFAVRESFYPPKGTRSIGYSRCNSYGIDFDKYMKEANDDISLIIQIENFKAIENSSSIFSRKGIDGTFIGPLDLQGSMKNEIIKDGAILTEETLKQSYDMALDVYDAACNKFHLSKGIHIVHPTKENIEQAREDGYKMIALGLDTVFIADRAKELFNQL